MLLRNLMFAILGVVAIGTFSSCSVDKTEEGEMPEVSVEGGNLPEYDVDGPDVDVGTETREVEVPTVDIDLPDDNDDEIAEEEVERDGAYTNR